MEAEGSRLISDDAPVREDEDRRCGEFREEGAYCVLHGGGEFESSAFF